MPKLLKSIRDEMKRLPRDPAKYPKLRVTKVESRPAPGINSLTFKAVVSSQFPGSRDPDDIPYITFVQFFDVLYEDKKKGKFTVPAKVGGTLKYHKVPSITGNRVALKCSCQDFRFVWEFPLFENDSLIGRFRKYTRVPGSTKPPRNPDDLQGFCKHVWSLLNALNRAGSIKEVPSL